MPIDALPPAPQPTDDTATFNAKAFALLAALPTFVTQANAVESAVDADASAAGTANTNAQGAKTAAETARDAAAASAASALASVTDAAAAGGAPAWVSGATYTLGQPAYSTVTRLVYRRTVAGAGTTDPSADATNWALPLTPADSISLLTAGAI
jgi:hypothetical protein